MDTSPNLHMSPNLLLSAAHLPTAGFKVFVCYCIS